MKHHPDQKPTPFSRAKRLAAWAGIATAILTLCYQAYTFVSILRAYELDRARQAQIADDRLSVVERTTTETQRNVRLLTEQVGRIEGKLDARPVAFRGPALHGMTIAPSYEESRQ